MVERFYQQSEAVYPERYQERYGFGRPIIGTVVEKFLECEDLKQGFEGGRIGAPALGLAKHCGRLEAPALSA